jgi:hypothetical protein
MECHGGRRMSNLDFKHAQYLLPPLQMSLRILLIGNGGREHALAWKLSHSPTVERVFVCPGNGGIHNLPKTSNIDLSTTDFPALVNFAQKNEAGPNSFG